MMHMANSSLLFLFSRFVIDNSEIFFFLVRRRSLSMYLFNVNSSCSSIKMILLWKLGAFNQPGSSLLFVANSKGNILLKEIRIKSQSFDRIVTAEKTARLRSDQPKTTVFETNRRRSSNSPFASENHRNRQQIGQLIRTDRRRFFDLRTKPEIFEPIAPSWRGSLTNVLIWSNSLFSL